MTHLWYTKGVRLLVALSLFFSISLFSQDPSFSQFYANRIYLNPAFAGIEGGISATSIARMQWARVDRGFRTYGFTLETRLPAVRLGLGLHLLHDDEGIAYLRTNQVGAVLSYTIPGRHSNFHFGMESRMVQKSVDWDALVFSDQLDPLYGNIGGSNVLPVLENVFYGDFDFGFLWRHEGKLNLGKRSISNVRSHLGVSLHHLPYLNSRSARAGDSFLNQDGRVAPRLTLHGGMIIPMTIFQGSGLNVSFSPNFKLDVQGYKLLNSKGNITVGTLGAYALVSNFYVGMHYQNRHFAPSAFHTDALIFTVGGYTEGKRASKGDSPKLFFGLSVDFNASGIGPAAGSVFEATVRYRFEPVFGLGGRGNGRSSKNVLDCKSFF